VADVQTKLAKVKTWLENLRREEKIAGMAVAITDRDNILFAEGFGVESIERPEVKVTKISLFRIASITKVITGITMLSLVEEGKLQLDAPVKEIVPWLTLSDKKTEEGVTLRHLLSHTSGLEAEYTPDGFREESALEVSLREGLPKAKILFPLGKGYQYSNWGIRLASFMAEEVTGKRFTQLAQERVLAPLGMTMTTFDLHIAATFPLCLAHTEENGTFKVYHRIEENAARYAAGGLFSNVEDLCRLARFLLKEGQCDSGERILSRESVAQMKRKHTDSVGFDGYGLTLLQDDFHGSRVYGHHGSAPPYATSMIVHPESGLGVVTLMNTQRDHLRFAIPKALLEMLTE